MTEVGFGLGSNLGDKLDNLERALALLFDGARVRFGAASSIYRTEPWGYADQDWFANLCATGSTDLSPEALLDHCKAVEQAVGREQTFRWGPRVIDVDILFYGDADIERPELTIPHRDIFNRDFVLVPLAEIRPELVMRGRSVGQAADAVDRAALHILAPPWRPDSAARPPSP